MAQGVPQRLENKCVFLRLKSPLQRPSTHSQEQTDVARVIKRNSGTLSLSLGFRQDKGHHKGGSSVRRVGGAWCGMSAALLRRGLELLAASEAPPAAASQAKASGAPVKRARRAKAKASQARKLRNSAKGKVPKSALAEYQKRECQDHLQANLKFMTSVRSTVAESVSEQIVQQNRGRKACDRPAVRRKKKAEGTVFTEEDFQKFQQEYFGS